jgi:hypothetical protein
MKYSYILSIKIWRRCYTQKELIAITFVMNSKKNSVVLVHKRTIPTERPQPADEVSANFS